MSFDEARLCFTLNRGITFLSDQIVPCVAFSLKPLKYQKTEILLDSKFILHNKSLKRQEEKLMNRKFRKNKKAMSIVISTVIIIAISITMAIAVAFWAMGLGNSFTKFEKVEFVSIYADIPVPRYVTGLSAFPVYIQLQNTGQIAVTINNVFLNDKPYSAYPYIGTGNGQNLVPSILNVGVRNNGYYIYLPVSTLAGQPGWKSGDYVEVLIETTSGHQYSNTVLLP